MRSPSHPRSIAFKLSWMNALVSSIALLLAYVSFFTYDLVVSRQSAVANLTSDAQIIGANTVSAILFDDPAAAGTTLSALRNASDITAGAIYTQSGELFADYSADGHTLVRKEKMPEGATRFVWENGIDVLVASRIISDGKPLGTVYIQAHLTGVRIQTLRYALITAGILLFCLGVALLAGSVFRRLLSEPIVSLARTARLVSRYRDYTLRFEPTQSYTELVSLTEAFNEMLGEIQQRDVALEQARNQLEIRVEERTMELRAANRELESFSYTVAHDLRGPLEIISNICYLMQSQEASPLAADPMLDSLGTSVKEMSSIIDDLLNLSRATSAGLHLKQIDLSALAASILQGLITAHPERTVQTVIQPGCRASADKGLIHIVLQNLLRNAWKFTGRSAAARIEFGCTQDGAESVYFIRDNGAGFDQRKADRLFKPFQRLHTENEFSGTGIGLATVQRVIGRHEGRVWAEGEIGKGATFYFTIGSPKL